MPSPANRFATVVVAIVDGGVHLWLIKSFVLCAQLATIKFKFRTRQIQRLRELQTAGLAFEWRQFRCTNNLDVNQRNEHGEWHQTINILTHCLRHFSPANSKNIIVHWQQTHHFHFARSSFSSYCTNSSLFEFFLLPGESTSVQFTYNKKLVDLAALSISRSWDMEFRRRSTAITSTITCCRQRQFNWEKCGQFVSIMNWIQNGIRGVYEKCKNAHCTHLFEYRKSVDVIFEICIFRFLRWRVCVQRAISDCQEYCSVSYCCPIFFSISIFHRAHCHTSEVTADSLCVQRIFIKIICILFILFVVFERLPCEGFDALHHSGWLLVPVAHGKWKAAAAAADRHQNAMLQWHNHIHESTVDATYERFSIKMLNSL